MDHNITVLLPIPLPKMLILLQFLIICHLYFLAHPSLLPVPSYFLSSFARLQDIQSLESSGVQTTPAENYANFMTYKKDIQVKVLILISQVYRIRFVALSGVASLPKLCNS